MARRPTQPYAPLVARLKANGFVSSDLEAALAELRDQPADTLARGLLAAYLDEPPDFSDEGFDAVSDFAAFLVLAAGKPAAAEACLHADRHPRLDPGTQHVVARLLEHLGIEPQYEATAEFRQAACRMAEDLLAEIPKVPERLDVLAGNLLPMPASLRPIIALELLEQLHAKEQGTFAALALLMPLDDATRLELARCLAHGGSEGRSFLAGLHPLDLPRRVFEAALKPILAEQARPVPAPDLKRLPLDWPVKEAYASVPDGQGSQAIYLVRQRPDRQVALVGGVLSSLRGVADGLGLARMPVSEARDFVAELRSGLSAVVPVPAEYALERLRHGLDLAEERGLPVPYSFQACRYLLSGLWGLAPVGVCDLVAAWADPERLRETDLLLGDAPAESFFYMDDGTHQTHDFFKAALPLVALASPTELLRRPVTSRDLDPRLAEALELPISARTLEALDQVIDRHAERILTDGERRRWQEVLEQLAYAYDRTGATPMRTLAATAAWAVAPGSGVRLSEQPFIREVLRLSAFQADAQREQQAFEAGEELDLLTLLADRPELARALGLKPAKAKPAKVPATLAKAFQLKISLAGAKPPIWRRVVVPADFSLGDLHRLIQVIMGWHDTHLHVFTHQGDEYSAKGMIEGARNEDKVRLGQLVSGGEGLGYEYDFGDGWQLRIQVEKALDELPMEPLPYCVTGKRAAPPEDSGGVWGYYAMLEALEDPADPEHEDALEWLGEDFDPEGFEVASINAMLQPTKPARRGRKPS